MLTSFVGLEPRRGVGREFSVPEPFVVVFLFLISRLVGEEVPEERLVAFEGLDRKATLTDAECQLLARGLDEFLSDEGLDYLVWMLREDCPVGLPVYVLPRVLRESLLAWQRFLRHAGGLRSVSHPEPVRAFRKGGAA